MAFPIRKLCVRAALIAIMLAGGLLSASMASADADEGQPATALSADAGS